MKTSKIIEGLLSPEKIEALACLYGSHKRERWVIASEMQAQAYVLYALEMLGAEALSDVDYLVVSNTAGDCRLSAVKVVPYTDELDRVIRVGELPRFDVDHMPQAYDAAVWRLYVPTKIKLEGDWIKWTPSEISTGGRND